jgi:hypothetical protein
MSDRRVLTVGLEERETDEIRERTGLTLVAHIGLPRLLLDGGVLHVERRGGPGWLPVSHVLFHSIYADDLEPQAALALWGGPCLPSAAAMMDCRLRLPCLVRALRYTRFGGPPRGFISAGAAYAAPDGAERVAKWGNWHCGENKARFSGVWHASDDAGCLIEPYVPGEAVRVALIGDRAFQVRLSGPDWKKSIHDGAAELMEPDPELVADARAVQAGFGLEVLANDYVISPDGAKFLLEVNHIPNVDRFPAIRDAYCDLAVDWLGRA